MVDDLKSKATKAFGWSFAKSWSVKAFSLLVFFILARLLSPQELGIAQAVTLILAFVAIVGDFGFPAALVQSRVLKPADSNLPFFVSVFIGCVAAAAMVVFADRLALMIDAPQASNLIRLAAIAPPVTAAASILMALRRRDLDFKSIARAGVFASLISGISAMSLAWLGAGPLALVVQALMFAAVNFTYLWRRSEWRPRWQLQWQSLKLLIPVSSFVFASSLLDFFALRLMDLTIVGRFGVAALGIYAVGAKLYLTMLELLSGTLIDVGSSMMAKIREDTARLRSVHLRLLFLASSTTSAVFAMLSALAPELCLLLFGAKWAGAEKVAVALAILGAVQVVQFFNGALLLAVGRSKQVFMLNVAKFGACFVAVGLIPADGITDVAWHFMLAQLLITPVVFATAMNVTGAKLRDVVEALWPGWGSAAFAWCCVWLSRDQFGGLPSYIQLLILFGVFWVSFLVPIALLRGRRLKAEVLDVWATRKARP